MSSGKRGLVFALLLILLVVLVLAVKSFWLDETLQTRENIQKELEQRLEYAAGLQPKKQIAVLKELVGKYKGVKGIEQAYYRTAEIAHLQGLNKDLKWAAKALADKFPQTKFALQAVQYLERANHPSSPSGAQGPYEESLKMRMGVLVELERAFPREEFRYLRGEALFLLKEFKESEEVLSGYVREIGQKEPYYPSVGEGQQGLLNHEVEPCWAWMLLARIHHSAEREQEKEKAIQECFACLARARIPEPLRQEILMGLESEKKALQ